MLPNPINVERDVRREGERLEPHHWNKKQQEQQQHNHDTTDTI